MLLIWVRALTNSRLLPLSQSGPLLDGDVIQIELDYKLKQTIFLTMNYKLVSGLNGATFASPFSPPRPFNSLNSQVTEIHLGQCLGSVGRFLHVIDTFTIACRVDIL